MSGPAPSKTRLRDLDDLVVVHKALQPPLPLAPSDLGCEQANWTITKEEAGQADPLAAGDRAYYCMLLHDSLRCTTVCHSGALEEWIENYWLFEQDAEEGQAAASSAAHAKDADILQMERTMKLLRFPSAHLIWQPHVMDQDLHFGTRLSLQWDTHSHILLSNVRIHCTTPERDEYVRGIFHSARMIVA